MLPPHVTMEVDEMYGPRYYLAVDPNALVATIKAELAQLTKVPIEFQILLLAGCQLQDNQPLAAYSTCDFVEVGFVHASLGWCVLEDVGFDQ